MSDRKYSIEEHNPQWAEKFKEIKKDLQNIFKDKYIYIEHVGSTSIPGLKSKPLIDVLVVVKNWEDFEKEKEEMVGLGYDYRSNVFPPASLLFYKEKDGHKSENIHVFEVGTPKIDEFINVRDYLKAHPEQAREYAELKENLISRHPDDYVAYREGKGEFLKEINRLAREWKEKAIVIPGSFSLVNAYPGYKGIDIWLKNSDKSIGDYEWIIAHSAGAAYFLTRPELHDRKVILINPLVKRRSFFSLFVRDVRFFRHEGIKLGNLIPFSNWPYAALRVLKLLSVNVLNGLKKLPKENVFIIRGTKDDYFCDSENADLVREEGFTLYEVEAKHNWNDNIGKKVEEIINSN